MQGATEYHKAMIKYQRVSIHAPYAGSDIRNLSHLVFFNLVSIHAPYAGSDCFPDGYQLSHPRFQSTPPMQGATGNT